MNSQDLLEYVNSFDSLRDFDVYEVRGPIDFESQKRFVIKK